MADILPFPFATLLEFQARWPDMPAGSDAHALVLLEDASQFIHDTVPSAGLATVSTRRRVVCAVVRRSMAASSADTAGFDNVQVGGGPFQFGGSVTNPNGDFYLTKQERKALGDGTQKAFGVQIAFSSNIIHAYWCDLYFGGLTCSCGADIAGEPIFGGTV